MTSTLRAGDSLQFTYANVDYPSPTWSLAYYLAGPSKVTVMGVSDGEGGWTVSMTSFQTSVLTPGLYTETLRVFNGTDVHTLVSSTVRILPDPATQAPTEFVPERMVSLIEKALLNQLSDEEAIESMSIGGRSLQFLSRAELLDERNYWLKALSRATGRSGIKSIPISARRIF